MFFKRVQLNNSEKSRSMKRIVTSNEKRQRDESGENLHCISLNSVQSELSIELSHKQSKSDRVTKAIKCKCKKIESQMVSFNHLDIVLKSNK